MVMLAPGSAPARNDQKSALSGVIYEKQTSPQLKSLIDQLLAGDLSSLPTDFERANVR
jgi:Zn-dependent M32 family carboxypeptidase